jgi:hypothetical protein
MLRVQEEPPAGENEHDGCEILNISRRRDERGKILE